MKNEVVAVTADAIDNVKATGMGILTSTMMPVLRDDENIPRYRSCKLQLQCIDLVKVGVRLIYLVMRQRRLA